MKKRTATRLTHSANKFAVTEHRHLQLGTACGGIIFALLLLTAMLAPLALPMNSMLSPLHIDLSQSNLPPLSTIHWLGTDHLGRDVLSQAVWGSRTSLMVGIFAALAAITFGSFWGATSALVGGVVDDIMMRAVDGLLAIPNVILLLALQAFVSTPLFLSALPKPLLSLLKVTAYSQGLMPLLVIVFAIAATSWLEAARICRARVFTLKSEEYLIAARSIGASNFELLIKHLLPNAASVLIVEATLLISDAVLLEASLSFLGLGLGPSIPSWGGMLESAQMSLIQGNWWTVATPGALITLTVAAVHLLGEGTLTLTGLRRQLF